MGNKICISKNNIIILLLIFIIIYLYYKLFKNNNEQSLRKNNEQSLRKNNEQNLRKNNEENIKNNNEQNESLQYIKNNNEQNELLQYIKNKERDEKIVYDVFTAPERRDNASYTKLQNISYINLPTRGYPDNYQLLGVLLRNNTENGFNLFGRQKFSGSNQYEYYAVGKLDNTDIKIPIFLKGDKEILDGDEIFIDGTNNEKGAFRVKLYNYETYRYNPFIY